MHFGKDCSLSDCRNKAAWHISWIGAKGTMGLCRKCHKIYRAHDSGRCKAIRDYKEKTILKELKPILQEHCKGTRANCYNIYQELKKKLKPKPSYKTDSGVKK